MGFFSKKYNKDKDYLIKKFNAETKEYYYMKIINGQEVKIDYEDLDRSTKKQLLNENRNLLIDKSLLEKEIENYEKKQRFQYLQSIGYNCTSFEYLGKVEGTVSNKMREYLDQLLNEKNVLIGIHRVGQSFDSNILDDTFQNGLKMTGHMGGAVSTSVSLDQNVSYYASNKIIEKELMYADAYKNSKGSILIKIPDSVLESGNDIFISDGYGVRLNPKYIIGYVAVFPNHHIENIILNSNFYENDKSSNKTM